MLGSGQASSGPRGVRGASWGGIGLWGLGGCRRQAEGDQVWEVGLLIGGVCRPWSWVGTELS